VWNGMHAICHEGSRDKKQGVGVSLACLSSTSRWVAKSVLGTGGALWTATGPPQVEGCTSCMPWLPPLGFPATASTCPQIRHQRSVPGSPS